MELGLEGRKSEKAKEAWWLSIDAKWEGFSTHLRRYPIIRLDDSYHPCALLIWAMTHRERTAFSNSMPWNATRTIFYASKWFRWQPSKGRSLARPHLSQHGQTAYFSNLLMSNMTASSWDVNLAPPGHLMFSIVASKGLNLEKPTDLFVCDFKEIYLA